MSKKRRILFTIYGCFFCIFLGACDWVGTLSQKEIQAARSYVVTQLEQEEWGYNITFPIEHEGTYGFFLVGLEKGQYCSEFVIPSLCSMVFLEDWCYVDDNQTGQHYKFLYSFDYSSYTFLEEYPSLILETLRDEKNEFAGKYDFPSWSKNSRRDLYCSLDAETRAQYQFHPDVEKSYIRLLFKVKDDLRGIVLHFECAEKTSGSLVLWPISQAESSDRTIMLDLPIEDYPLCEDSEKLTGYLALLPQIDMRDFFLLSDEAEAE